MIGSGSASDDGPSAWSQERVDGAATARVVVNDLGIVTSWNDGARRLLGYRAAEVVGRKAAVLLGDAAPTHALPSLTGLRRWSGTATLLHRDGHRVTVGLLAHHRDADGGDWLLVSPVARPAPTPEDDAFVRRSFAQAPYAMALYDTGLRLRWANADMERVMGLSEREMRGLRVTEIVLDPESDRAEEGMRTALETGRLQELGAALHLAGHERESVWSVSLVPVRVSDGRLVTCHVCILIL
jgi:PAS domain S-box-containing protein